MSDAVREQPVRAVGAFSAFNSKAFRLYFGGQLVSVTGTWMQAVAQQVVVYDLTKSELALGLVACAQGLPALILTPFAGVLVERLPRRQIIILTQTVMMVLAFLMAFLQFTNSLQVWHIVVLSLGLGVANALDAPARQAFVVEMVGHEQLTSGIVLNSIMINSARVIGPAVGGLALKTVGPAWCFFLNGASFLAVIASLLVMQVAARLLPSGKILIVQPLIEGLQFVRSHPTIRPLILLSVTTSLFGITFATLIPAFADQVLHDTSGGTAALLAAQGVGAVAAGILVARVAGRGHGGKFLTTFALLGPMCILGLALSLSYPPSMLFMGLAGFFMIGQFILMNTLIQTEVPDDFRGRVLSLYTLSFFGLNPFSALIIGLVAQSIGTLPAMLIWGGLGLLCSALILGTSFHVRSLS